MHDGKGADKTGQGGHGRDRARTGRGQGKDRARTGRGEDRARTKSDRTCNISKMSDSDTYDHRQFESTNSDDYTITNPPLLVANTRVCDMDLLVPEKARIANDAYVGLIEDDASFARR